MIDSSTPYERLTAYGFYAITFMVFMMVIIGGLTRLTGSGLSIVEWQPITGFLPPFSQSDWEVLFSKYQQSPEFMFVNSGMDLNGFKGIFWLEFIHRAWGRLIGLVLCIPTVMVFSKTDLRSRFGSKTILLWVLGTAQGALGWYMVKSGLIKDPHVSPYRLTAHLLMAFLILGLALQTGLSLTSAKSYGINRFSKRTNWMIFLVVLTACFGGLVAGLKAGLLYNTYPKMDANWLPESMWALNPLWKNLTENPGTVQFFHRVLATLTFISVLFISVRLLNIRHQQIKNASLFIISMVTLQFGLGITTLLLQVPIHLALFHQMVALLLFIGLIVLKHRLTLSRLR